MCYSKPYNLTYFITFIAIATLISYKYVPSHKKPYKIFYIGGFIMKTIKEFYSIVLYLSKYFCVVTNRK